MESSYTTDVIVIGGGHAGCEAALAAARLGADVILAAISLDSIAMMPCNPNIGGTSKGHLVREIDALGGEMGKNIDKAFIQSRMLNMGKGPAVYSLRAQADKAAYYAEMKKVLENTAGLRIRQAEICGIVYEGKSLKGVVSQSGAFYACKAVVLCAGTYLNARCLYGETIVETGPNGLKNSTALSGCLQSLGIRMLRYKTGTPARIDGRTVDFSKMEEQKGDERIVPFSFSNRDISRRQVSCWLTYTTEETHRIIRDNLHRSPMYSGVIEGTGTRYCPSIEDKIVRFADKARHQVFIEPEGENTNEMYVQGMSTSLPEDVQVKMYRSVPGLENCEITRNAYAIEYDCIDATQLYPTLEFIYHPNLFSAGQLNGSSGYEEAAAQGLVAGINAARRALGTDKRFIIDRSEGYIGVLIDDLVTKGSKEPYRMMTSRAEYRLLLRQDNADLRLAEKGFDAGLVSREALDGVLRKRELIDREIARVSRVNVSPGAANALLATRSSAEISTGIKLAELIKRPELDYECLKPLDEGREPLPDDVCEQVNIAVKYEGYIKRQMQQVAQFKKLESRLLPEGIDYNSVPNLRLEARQKLAALRPVNIGQASRITGVSPADISMLLIFLNKRQTEPIIEN